MLAERRDITHPRFDAVQADWRHRGPEPAGWRSDLAPALARRELRVIQVVLDRIHARPRDLGGVQPRNHFGRRQRAERRFDDVVQRVPMANPQRVGVEARIVLDLGALEDGGAESRPFARVLNPEVDLDRKSVV